MPHIRVEYSQTLDDHPEFNIRTLLENMHHALGQRSQNNVSLDRVQTRAIPCKDFKIGTGQKETYFVAAVVLLMAGRSYAVKKEIAGEQLSLIQEYLGELSSKTRITVDVQDLSSAYSYT
ncbi:MAG: hypothetical protein CMH32_06740 [Micavibrio sp.]|nr:hypothetical protein [Micavibrio sp.]|tara:strand:+ start:420 stop:779 length:360 start_codon:yes stop_codon:yes gene_type:complete